MNYDEALEYIHSVEWMGSRPGLSRTQELLARLGNPERDLKYVHVAGTNGKGSTCSMLDSVLREAGYKVGLYTSPYIVRFNERMCVDGEPIADEELAELVSVIKPIADAMEDKPTEFELITAIAFLYFKRHNCDIVVLEVGMGGRLDSTNVIESPIVAVITGIAIDHASVLGNTVREIAAEKAGIIKRGVEVVYGGRDDDAFEVICAKAEETEAKVTRVSHHTIKIAEMTVYGSRFEYDCIEDIELGLCGSYQPENASTVIETVRKLNSNGFYIDEDALRKGLKNAKWRARFELLNEDPIVIFDGSHNLQGVTAAMESVKGFFGESKVLLLMGVLADKEYGAMLDKIVPCVKSAFCITPPSPRALDSATLAQEFDKRGVAAVAFGTLYDGVEAAYREAVTQNMPLVMLGSLYMYGEVAFSLEKTKKLQKTRAAKTFKHQKPCVCK
ncbi:MAG: bifunctional folylpolyglutamate synthase/dihydrofolate synthase, partial [Clostridia bacterium]|nr:bifunctional folylpolyglutamate synthase/dihydrofolate synthase [Clostridia bacterium]